MATNTVRTPQALEREARKIALGMLSTRMQRVEKGVTGRNRGPPALSTDPELFSVIAPKPKTFVESPRPVGEVKPPSLKSHPDLLWREGRPQPPTAPKSGRGAYARFLPSHNKGKPTSHETLSNIAHSKAESVFNRAHAARQPARMAVRLSQDVLAMCRELEIDPQALMRESANPLAGIVPVMHGPHTPSWEYALGDVVEVDLDPGSPLKDVRDFSTTPTSARSMPGGSSKVKLSASPRKVGRAAQRASASGSGAAAAGSLSARAARARPPAVLSEAEVEETEKKVKEELEKLRKTRTNELKIRAKVQLSEQRRMAKSVALERQNEKWRENKLKSEQRKAMEVAEATKRHVREHETFLTERRGSIRDEENSNADRLGERWKLAEEEAEAKRQEMLQKNKERAEAEQKAYRERVRMEQQRAMARAEAVAEYEEARQEGEAEADARAYSHLEEKRNAASTRLADYEKRRQEALSKKRETAKTRDGEMEMKWDNRLKKHLMIEQQQKERFAQPYRMHEKDRQRALMAPREVERLNKAREARFEADLGKGDRIVEENRQAALEKHLEWCDEKRKARSKVVKNIEKANMKKAQKVEEHAMEYQQYEERVAKNEAKRAVREELIRKERESYRQTASMMGQALYESSVGAEVMTDGAIESLIAGGGGKRR